MQLIKFIFITLLTLFCIVGCSVRKEPPKEKEKEIVTRTVTEVLRDTVVKVKSDNSYYSAWIECVNGKPIINADKITETRGESYMKPPSVKIKDDGQLSVRCEGLEQQLKFEIKERQILEERLKEKTIIPPPIEVEKPLTFWQKAWIKWGKISALAILIYLILKIPWRRLGKLF
ncbi:hypothetical protein [Riemerella anatipestifer]|uniref:Uncharacterized protein n=1 Tax=Riemerella anatipestifer TaxID=34085 RepID=A0A1S7DV18_RIEAN|nr:hypothetical protein [Riemerella anatipestifer]AQY22973.1 hypothetical protein AB406_2033 [Riemerella anatipestifer]MBT0556849.1 hypothetical protein [Riemerella anatipestifer]MCO7355772.1 hypothetical protein [Riemerella anatipestifer]MDY3351862.1 hypothetical protein [Riemerella anatipestifer]MDY3525045.1 hypothetical protein [Riemerella anatipestifer]